MSTRRSVATLAALLGAMLVVPSPAVAQANGAPTPAATAPASSAAAQGTTRRSSSGLRQRITIELRQVKLVDALLAIAQKAGVGLVQGDEIASDTTTVSVRLNSVEVRRAFEEVLRGTPYAVREKGGVVVIVRKEKRAEVVVRGAVFGRVTDSTSAKPLEGADVTVKGMTQRSVTNQNGYYLLRAVPSGVRTIVVRMVGYREAERDVAVVDSQQVRADFALAMGMTRLQEVVTTATGKQRRVEVANDITTIHVDSVIATAPIRSVTDLLETRVPGLTVQHTSGAPGDPSRLRLRGVSSVYGNNDPIVIVDGIRMYSAQSDSESANLAGGLGGAHQQRAAVPSLLDQIDPHDIETIEVLKGPSASTIYGADAANGVIVITTKRGHAGPSRWQVSASHGISYMPGRYPDAYLRFGHDYTGNLTLCPLKRSCAGVDSLVRFQSLNQPDITLLGHGGNTQVSLGVDGGSDALTYRLGGSFSDETGVLTLPSYVADRFEEVHGSAPPAWMRRPQTFTTWSATGRVTAKLGSHAEASVTTLLSRRKQQESSLGQQLTAAEGLYVDRLDRRYYTVTFGGLQLTPNPIPDFYRRLTDATTNVSNAAQVNWHPLTWLTGTLDAGLNSITRDDENLLPRDMLDTLGEISRGHGSLLLGTVNLQGLATAPLPLGLHFRFAVGANYNTTSQSDLTATASGLAKGTSGLNGASTIDRPQEVVTNATTAGWYVEPSVGSQRFFLSAGVRFDGGSAYGSHVSLPTFPKLGASWLISDEPWFPAAFKRVFNTLRLRAAYGHAGVQPGITDRVRLYGQDATWVDDGSTEIERLQTLGNTKLKPERSTELEGGFETDMFDDRLSLSFSTYRKVQKDALLQVPVAPSVYGANQTVWENIGVVRNTGVEATVSVQPLRSDLLSWSWTLGVSRNRNVVVSLAPGMKPFTYAEDARIAAGYPLFGRWARPILGYADENQDGLIEAGEVQLGDSLVYMGQTMPDYEASLHTTFSLFRGALTVDAGLDYQSGLTQKNVAALANQAFLAGANDPSAAFSEQAAVAVLDQTPYGVIQTVNTLRFNSLSVAYNLARSLARRLGADALSIALQGSNVGLFTNYRGKDPNVNAFGNGNLTEDTGVLPEPRSWQLMIQARY